MWPAFDYAHEEAAVVSPAMEISNAWRASAIPVGLGLMAIVALLRLFRFHDAAPHRRRRRRHGRRCRCCSVSPGPALAPLGKLNLIIFFVVVVAALRVLRRADRVLVRARHLRAISR